MGGPVSGLGRKRIDDAGAEAEAGTYRLEGGQLYHPAIAFRSALLSAGKGRRIGKLSAPGVLSGAVFLSHAECALVNPETGKPIKTYTIDVRRAVVQRAGVLRRRPSIDPWATTV